MRTVNQAVHDKPRQVQHVQSLVWRVDEFKLTLQLSMDVGVFAHVNSARLRHNLFARFDWLQGLFHISPEGVLRPRWVLQGATWAQQVAWMRDQWPHAACRCKKVLNS
jgi:hypothetical protein